MKNVTITLSEDVARWARVYAAKHDTSVSRMLGVELRKKMLQETRYEAAMERFFARGIRPLKPAGAAYPTRESLYERQVLFGYEYPALCAGHIGARQTDHEDPFALHNVGYTSTSTLPPVPGYDGIRV